MSKITLLQEHLKNEINNQKNSVKQYKAARIALSVIGVGAASFAPALFGIADFSHVTWVKWVAYIFSAFAALAIGVEKALTPHDKWKIAYTTQIRLETLERNFKIDTFEAGANINITKWQKALDTIMASFSKNWNSLMTVTTGQDNNSRDVDPEEQQARGNDAPDNHQDTRR